MRVTLLESRRRFLQTAECAALSIVAHLAVVAVVVSLTSDGVRLPRDEREAWVFFLLPPDLVDGPSRQAEVIQWGRLGADIDDGALTEKSDEGLLSRRAAKGRRGNEEGAGARGQLPFGPDVVGSDSVFSVLEVDQEVQRYPWSAAPSYPSDLLAAGIEGVVYAQFVVDTNGMVDTTGVRILTSAHPGFTASVREALRYMRFRPARRGGKLVRQLVEQRFRFAITPPPAPAIASTKQVS